VKDGAERGTSKKQSSEKQPAGKARTTRAKGKARKAG
jgi:hypothetical protein